MLSLYILLSRLDSDRKREALNRQDSFATVVQSQLKISPPLVYLSLCISLESVHGRICSQRYFTIFSSRSVYLQFLHVGTECCIVEKTYRSMSGLIFKQAK